MALVGRSRELYQLQCWLDAADQSASVLLIEGEAGIGKTELWSQALAVARDQGCRVLSCRTSSSESKLSYVGLADLLRPCPDACFEALPELQRRPLEVALLRAEAVGAELDPRAVGTGLLAMLQLLSRSEPLILAVDDGHWLDAASVRVLSFALRRVTGAGARLLVTLRTAEAHGATGLSFAQLEREIGARSIERLHLGPLSVAAPS
jgi:predicted ATPase